MAASAKFLRDSREKYMKPIPQDVQTRLKELEAEFLEGDITEKGYLKKKQRILEEARGPSLFAFADDNGAGENKDKQPRSSREIYAAPAVGDDKFEYESEELVSSEGEKDGNDNDDDIDNCYRKMKNGNGANLMVPHSTATITLACSRLKKHELMMAAINGRKKDKHDGEEKGENGIKSKPDGDDDTDLDKICQHYLEQGDDLCSSMQLMDMNNHGTATLNGLASSSVGNASLEDSHLQSEFRTEAVNEVLNNFREDNHHFRANLSQNRGNRSRSSSVTKQIHLIQSGRYLRRKSTSSARNSKSSQEDFTITIYENSQLNQKTASEETPVAAMPPQRETNLPSETPKDLTSSITSRAKSSASSSQQSASTSSTSSRREDSITATTSVAVSQVPDIILDVRDLDDRPDDFSQVSSDHAQTANDQSNSPGSGRSSNESANLEQLILSNFNSGTASMSHKKNKKSKNKNKGFRAQQVMYLSGRGTHASDLTRLTAGACESPSTNGQPKTSAAVPERPQFRGRVSTKIEQLARTLRRPKSKPLQEYFQDDTEILFGDASKSKDTETSNESNGQNERDDCMSPVITEPLKLTSGLPLNPVFALYRYGSSSSYRSQAISIVDSRSGKIAHTVYYHKLLENALKLAQALTHPKKITQLTPASDNPRHGAKPPKPGDRIALAFLMGDAISFATAFYACLLAGLVPVPIDVPTNTRREAFCQSIGIFIGAVGAHTVLTSFDVYRNLAKDPHDGGVAPIKCWPNVSWLLYDCSIASNLSKPSKSWKPYVTPESNPTNLESQLAFIQYSVTRDGDILPISVSYDCVTKHVQSLATAVGVVEGQLIVNLLDIKRDFGIWYSLLAAVYYGMHVVMVNFAQVKAEPMLWLKVVSKYKPGVVLSRSRDLYWTVMAQRDQAKSGSNDSKLDLSSIKQLIISDASSSWTVSPCETFSTQFASFGFKSDAITPVAFSPECLTVSIRRPGQVMGDARLSLDHLSKNKVLIDCSTLKCLALQDCGSPLPGSTLAVLRCGSNDSQGSCADLCKSDEIGEICISRHQQWTPSYYDLPGQTGVTFKVRLSQPKPQQPPFNPGVSSGETMANQDSKPVVTFTRSGLFGFVTPNGSVFIVGSRELSIFTNGRRYSADDLSATILAVEPQNFVYRARLCIFPVKLARDERIVAVVEQNCTQHATDSAAFAWMAKVIQAVDSIHAVSLYSLAVVQQGRLPRTPQGFINRHAVRRLFEDGHLHPNNILLCPHSAITNLPQPRLTPATVHPSAQLLSNFLHGTRFAVAQGPQISQQTNLMAKSESFDSQSAMIYNGHTTVSSCASHGSRLTSTPTPGMTPSGDSAISNNIQNQATLSERLRVLAQRDPDRVLFCFVTQRGIVEHEVTALQLHKRAERVASHLIEKARVQPNDRVVVLLPAPSGDFLAAIYGCFYVGCIPLVVRSPHADNLPATLSSCFLTVQMCKPVAILCTPHMARFFRSKETAKLLLPQKSNRDGNGSNNGKLRKLPKIISVDGTKTSSSKRVPKGYRPPSMDATLYIDLIVSSSGSLTGVKVSHASAMSLCRSIKIQAELYPSRDIMLAGLDPLSGLGFVMFVLESIFAGHKTIVSPLTEIEVDPFSWLRAASSLQMRDVFVSPATLELCVRGFFQSPASSAIREENQKICLTNVRSCIVVSEERPQTLLISQFVKAFQTVGLQRRSVTAAFGCRMNVAICLQPSNAPEPEQVHIDTKSLRNDRLAIVERGSPYAICLTSCGKVVPGAKAVIADPETRAQMGEDHLGEIWIASNHNTNGYFTVGGVTEGDADSESTLESFDVRFASRLETGDTSTMFARTGFLGFIKNASLFVVGPIEQSIFISNQRYQPCDLEATLHKLDPRRIPECAVFLASNLLVAVIEFEGPEAWALDLIPAATRCLLEAHQLIAGVVVIVEPGTVPLNSRGEKQRALLRDAFLADQLDPIYVSYNL